VSNGSQTPFDGLHVAIFEARMAGALAELVARQGGVPVAAPALREIAIEDNPDARSFVEGLLAGQFDVLIFETGVGVRLLVQSQGSRFRVSSGRGDGQDKGGRAWAQAGGGPPRAGRQSRLPGTEPNTWRETLALLDERCPSHACESPCRNTASRYPN